VRVILAAHGEAASRSWWEHFRVGQRTLGHASAVIPLALPLRLLICALGATRKCFSPRGASPHNALSAEQAVALADRLGPGFSVQAAFLASRPLLSEVLARPDDALTLVCSMMPTDSRLACGQLCRAVLARPSPAAPAAVLARLWDDAAFIRVNHQHLLEHAGRVDAAGHPSVLILALHGTLVRDARGEPPRFHTGEAEKRHFAEALRRALLKDDALPWQRVEIAYLNHGVGGAWSEPSVEALLARLPAQGLRSAQVFPCDYLVDGGETIHGLAELLASAALPCTQLPSLNAAPDFMDYLAGRVRAAAATPAAARHCDHCPLGSGTCL